MNKRYKTLLTALMLSVAATATAGPGRWGQGGALYDYARVVRVEPLVREVRVATPRQECWEETVPVRREAHHSATPMILGGIIGGVIGNQMGKGRGKDVATVAGTILGGSIGRDIANENHSAEYGTVSRERCRTVNEYYTEERVSGYRVTYRYRGEEFTTRMSRDPGERIRVRIRVEPVGY